MASDLDNYLAAEQLIITRLKETVPELVDVSDWSDYASINEAAIRTPSAYVLYLGDRPREAGGKGEVQRADQIWGVMIVVRNVAQRPGGGEIRETAGPLMMRTLRALMGWQPAPQYRPLERMPAPRPDYRDSVGYFPLQFATGVIIKGDPR